MSVPDQGLGGKLFEQRLHSGELDLPAQGARGVLGDDAGCGRDVQADVAQYQQQLPLHLGVRLVLGGL